MNDAQKVIGKERVGELRGLLSDFIRARMEGGLCRGLSGDDYSDFLLVLSAYERYAPMMEAVEGASPGAIEGDLMTLDGQVYLSTQAILRAALALRESMEKGKGINK